MVRRLREVDQKEKSWHTDLHKAAPIVATGSVGRDVYNVSSSCFVFSCFTPAPDQARKVVVREADAAQSHMEMTPWETRSCLGRHGRCVKGPGNRWRNHF